MQYMGISWASLLYTLWNVSVNPDGVYQCLGFAPLQAFIKGHFKHQLLTHKSTQKYPLFVKKKRILLKAMHLSSQGLIGVNWAIHTLDDNDNFNYKNIVLKIVLN